ncbi:MAG: CHAT domain-containing protein, partial [Cyanobacteria bacterium P01_C01_bin.72]
VTTSQPLSKTEIQLNQLNLLIASKQWQQVNYLVPQIQTQIARTFSHPSRRSLYAQVNFAKNVMRLSKVKANSELLTTNPEALLARAFAEARELSDTKAESYALGTLGNFYEQQHQWTKSRAYTQKALLLSQNSSDNRLKYQWQWQLGRLLAARGEQKSAIISYSEAVNSLESLRSDLIVTNIDNQFSFRKSIEPVYRELVSLLLQSPNNEEISQEHLLKARQTIESLQLAELNDYFREVCLDTQPTDIDNIDRQAAVIYPIILRDRLEVILTIPGQPLRHYSTPIPEAELKDKIEQLRQTVTIRSRRRFYEPATELYDWLIRPAVADLAQNKIETLVFVPDGVFRNIPMAVLYDGEHYLIEKYNLALTPGLQLLAPRPLKELKLKTLAAGLTESREGFAPLDYVRVEIEDIQNQLNSTVLLDGKFTQEALKTEIESAKYPVVHIATHGQFSSLQEDTFLLAWDGRISLNQLDSIFQKQDLQQGAIELLILSACETAVGDEKAALGLAGMAVKAGARSTIATLWSVKDRATALAISNFYQQLTQADKPMNKTQALRQTQLEFIHSREFRHPFYWAPFILVGNWL